MEFVAWFSTRHLGLENVLLGMSFGSGAGRVPFRRNRSNIGCEQGCNALSTVRCRPGPGGNVLPFLRASRGERQSAETEKFPDAVCRFRLSASSAKPTPTNSAPGQPQVFHGQLVRLAGTASTVRYR